MNNLHILQGKLAESLPLPARRETAELAISPTLLPLALLHYLQFLQQSGRPLVCITADKTARRALIGQLQTWVTLLHEEGEAGKAEAIVALGDRQWGFLERLQQKRPLLLVADRQSILEPIPSAAELQVQTLTIRSGEAVGMEQLLRRLQKMGYESVPLVVEPGQIARRGGILDVFVPGLDYPLRIEFWEDEVHSLRYFSPEDQRSIHSVTTPPLHSLVIPPLVPTQASASIHDVLPPNTLLVGEAEALESLTGNSNYAQIRVSSELSVDSPLHAAEIPSAKSKTKQFFQTLLETRQRIDRVTVISQHVDRLRELLDHGDTRVYGHLMTAANQALLATVDYRQLEETAHPIQGFESQPLGSAVFTDFEIFGLVRSHAPTITRQKSYYLKYLEDISIGDFVVHEDHGIGQYAGIQSIAVQGVQREYARIDFAGTDKVYLPITQLHKVAKYIGGDEDQIQLSKLGSRKWKALKKKAERDTAMIARELLSIYARRQAATGFAFPDDEEMTRALRASFPYMETRDQMQAIQDVFEDMNTEHPMDRLLCGDVGFGKTEVSLRAAFRAVLSGKQVALLCPTTILADQHYQTYMKRLEPFGVKIGLLSRFRTPTENQRTITAIQDGTIDVVIGTHRLLSQDVTWHDLGLLIIDEEQRFGVMHKDRIQSLRAGIDVLAMTATPIPRTLHLSLVGIRDVSILVSPPQGRKSVRTLIEPFGERLLQSAIEAELERGGQVFIVYNRVRSIDSFARRVAELLPSARIIVGHGQLGADEIEEKMHLFTTGHVDVLIASRIIENGMDIPTANTMIVVGAEAFGLSTLHQFRGRVGRSSEQGYAYFLTYQEPLSRAASRRLEALRETAELGSGFQIAMRDLEIRGAGNILGIEQSGHIDGIGFELYSRLLSKAIRAQKQVIDQDRTPLVESDAVCTVELPLTAYFDDAYIGLAEEKIALYKRLLDTRTVEDNQAFAAELIDRFGPLPQPAANLLQINYLRILALQARMDSIQIKEGWLVCHFRRLSDLPTRLPGPEWQFQRELLSIRIRVHALGRDWIASLEIALLSLAAIS